MIKAILFDFDGVLTIDKTGSQSIINYLTSKTDISYDKLKTAYYKYNNGLLLGEYTHKDIWDSLCRDVHKDMDFQLLIDAFKNTALDREMIAYVSVLRKDFKTGLITDNKRDRIDVISQLHHFGKIFDVISVSADFHSGKDERVIFEKTIVSLDVTPSECIFIDNTPKNLVMPQLMGMTTILFDDENRNIDEFKNKMKNYI